MPPSFAHSVERTSGSVGSGPVLGTVVAAAAITCALALALPDGEEPDPPAPDPAAGFLAAYERSRTTELLVESTFTRTFNDGRELAYETRLVQRPPDDVLVVGAGTASGRLRGRIIRCNATAADAPPDCIESGVAPPYTDVVAQELETLEVLLAEIYEVEQDDAGCWILTLEVVVANPRYGGAARFCFDEASGALRHLEVRKPEAVEVTEVVSIATEVTDADLRVGSLGDPIGTG